MFWFAMFAAGLAMAPFFMMNTTLSFDAPIRSPSGIADKVLVEHFPKLNKMATGVVIVRAADGESVFGADGKGTALEKFSLAFNETVYAFQPGKPQIVVEVDGYTSIAKALGPTGESMGRELFISPHEEAAIILVQASSVQSVRYIDFVTWVSDAIQPALAEAKAADPTLKLSASQTGLGMFIQESLHGVEENLTQMDCIAMPIALAVLAYVLRSWRLMIVPPICILVSAATSFGVMMFPISHATQIISFAPSVMMSCTVAMSFDYSLFLLSRYQEEVVQHGAQLEDAVHAMLCCAGHTVLVSGCTLMICWLGLTFFPVTLLSSGGLAAAMSILSTLMVNLSLTPVLILTFPHFFYTQLIADTEKPGTLAVLCCGGSKRAGVASRKVDEDTATSLLPSPPTESHESGAQALLNDDTERQFYRLGESVLGCKYGLVLLLAVATIPMVWVVTRLSYAVELQQLTPRDSPATQSMDYLKEKFGAGNAFAYTLVIEPPEGQTVMSEQFFVQTNAAISKIVQGIGRPHGTELGANWPHVRAAGIMIPPPLPPPTPVSPDTCTTKLLQRKICGGLMAQTNQSICLADPHCCYNGSAGLLPRCFNKGTPAPTPSPTAGGPGALMWGLVDAWTQCKEHKNVQLCESTVIKDVGPLIEYSMSRFVSPDRKATYVTMQLSLDPFGETGQEWVEYVRRELPSGPGGVIEPRYYLTHGAAEIMDAADTVYSLFPTVAGGTLAVVLVLYCIGFGSIVLPIRAVISICFAAVWVFGLAILVYEDGVLQWTHYAPISPVNGSPRLCWLIPVMSFSIMVGLSLDYDVFLVSRIVEYRAEGKSDVDSVLLGLAKTGRIIAAAGIIMAIAFFGLLLSSQASMNQLSFFLVVAVLFDTFVVRLFFVPAMMGILGKANWYPMHMPGPDFA